MWSYEKKLQYPVNITKPNAKIAQIIMSQYGGPDGEMGASMRYLSQRYAMPNRKIAGILTDIGTEELAHLCWIWILKYPYLIILSILNHKVYTLQTKRPPRIYSLAVLLFTLYSHCILQINPANTRL